MSTHSSGLVETFGESTAPAFRGITLSASITATDLPKSMIWYSEVLGFGIEEKYEQENKLMAVTLAAGDVRILLTQDDGAKGWDRAKGEGISLMITTDQNVDDIAKRIKENGHALDTEPTDMPWGARMFRFRDPDGFKFVISSERSA